MLLYLIIAFIAAVSSEPTSNQRFRPEYSNYQDNSQENLKDELTPPLATYEHQEYPSDHHDRSAESSEENKKDFPDREGHLENVSADLGFVDDDVADNPSNRGWQDEVPGTAGKDYPNLKYIPETSFSCADKVAGGYYADVETGCQVFHVCNTGGVKSSFLCPPGSIFNQKYFVCDWWYDFECDSAPELYSLNKQLNHKASGEEKSTENNPLDQYQNVGNSLTENGDLSLAGTGHSRYQENSQNHFDSNSFNSDSNRGKSFSQDFQVNESKSNSASSKDTYRGRITVSYWPPQNEKNQESREQINREDKQSNTQNSDVTDFTSTTQKPDNVPRGFSLNPSEFARHAENKQTDKKSTESQGGIRYSESENSNRVGKKLFNSDTEYLSPPKPGNTYFSIRDDADYDNDEENESGKSSDASRDGNFGQKFLSKPSTSFLEPPSETDQQGNYNNVIKNDYQVPLNKDYENKTNQNSSRDEKSQTAQFSSRKSIGRGDSSGKSSLEPSVLSRREFPESKVEEDGIYLGPINTDSRVSFSGNEASTGTRDSQNVNQGFSNNYRTSEKDLIYERPPLPPLPAFPVAYIDFARSENRRRTGGFRSGLGNGFPSSNKNLAGSEVIAGTTTTISPTSRRVEYSKPLATSGEERKEISYNSSPGLQTEEEKYSTTEYSSSPQDGATFDNKHVAVNHSGDKFIPSERDSQGQREYQNYFPDNGNRNSYTGGAKGNRFHEGADNDRENSYGSSNNFDNVNRSTSTSSTSNSAGNHFTPYDSFNEDGEERYLPTL